MDSNEIKEKITEGIDKFNQNENVKLAKQELKKGSEAIVSFFTNRTEDTKQTQGEVIDAEFVDEEAAPSEEPSMDKESTGEASPSTPSTVSMIKEGAAKAGKAVSTQLGKAWSAVDGGLVKRKLLKEITAYSLDELNSALKASSDVNDKELILNIIMRKKQLLALQSLGHDEKLLEEAYRSIRAERDELVEQLSAEQ